MLMWGVEPSTLLLTLEPFALIFSTGLCEIDLLNSAVLLKSVLELLTLELRIILCLRVNLPCVMSPVCLLS